MFALLRRLKRAASRILVPVLLLICFGFRAIRRRVMPLLKYPEGRLGRLLATWFLPFVNDEPMNLVVEAAGLRPSSRVLELGFANGAML
jgi:hypothetical protein